MTLTPANKIPELAMVLPERVMVLPPRVRPATGAVQRAQHCNRYASLKEGRRARSAARGRFAGSRRRLRWGGGSAGLGRPPGLSAARLVHCG